MMERAFCALADPARLQIISFLAHMHHGKAIVDRHGQVFDGTTEASCCLITQSPSRFVPLVDHLYELEAAGLVAIGHQQDLLTCSLRPHTLKSLAEELMAFATLEHQNGCV